MTVQISTLAGETTRTVFNVRAIHPRENGGFELAMEFSDIPVIVRPRRTLHVVESERE